MNEETNAGTTVGTAPTQQTQVQSQVGGQVNSPSTMPSTTPTERMYSKAQVTDLMKRRVERSHQSFFKRYGVKDLQGLDDLFTKTRSYDEMERGYGALKMENDDLQREIAFLKNNIDPNRYNDIKAYFKGSELAFSNDALIEAIKTHPEWLKKADIPTTTISSLGVSQNQSSGPDEKEIAAKLFGVQSL